MHGAEVILTLLTAEDSLRVKLIDDSFDDLDFTEEPVEVETDHRPSISTIKKILDMFDGTEGQRRRSFDSIRKLHLWFQRKPLNRYRAKTTESHRAKSTMLNQGVLRLFSEARNHLQPVHGLMMQHQAEQCARSINLTDFGASDSWLTSFKRRNSIVSRKVMNDTAPKIAVSIANFR